MIPRYTSKEMGSIWTEENEDRNIVKVEVTACEAMNKLGIVPDDALHDIQTKADFDLDRVHEIEKTTNHDIISLLTSVAELDPFRDFPILSILHLENDVVHFDNLQYFHHNHI